MFIPYFLFSISKNPNYIRKCIKNVGETKKKFNDHLRQANQKGSTQNEIRFF
jgi:hypothetical protein